MSAQPVPKPGGQVSSAAVHAVAAFAAAVVVAGGILTWVLLTTPSSDARLMTAILVGGAAAAVIVVAGATATAYYATLAAESRAAAAVTQARARRLEEEFSWLTRETLPVMARRVRAGATPAEVFEGIPRPETDAVRDLLTTVQRLQTDVMDRAEAARVKAEEAARAVAADAEEAARAAAAEAAASGQRETAVSERLAACEAGAERLRSEAIPRALERLRAGEPRDMVLDAGPELESPALSGLFETVVTELAVAERRAAAAMAACANAAARVQAQTTRMLADLREMEQKYGDDKVFADLMSLDHLVSQTGRFADSIAVLSGGRSGRRWTRPIPVESVLRGAMGRIDAYQRVRVHSTSTTAVAGYAAEGVMHALAELMDNATAFSAHGSAVHVYVEEEDAGLVLTIEDSGLGMRPRERQRAEQAVTRPLDLATLPGTRLGLAVVGRVASRYGLSVSFRPSARGGTGVVMMIPRTLLSTPKEASSPWSSVGDSADDYGTDDVFADRYGAGGGGTDGPDDSDTQALTLPGQLMPGHSAGPEEDTFELPVRPRGKTLAEASKTPLAPRADLPAPPSNPGARFAAFRNSVTSDSLTSDRESAPGFASDHTVPEAGAARPDSEHQGSEGTE